MKIDTQKLIELGFDNGSPQILYITPKTKVLVTRLGEVWMETDIATNASQDEVEKIVEELFGVINV